MTTKDIQKANLLFNRKVKITELNKTPERKKFEEEYSCYIFSLRPPNTLTPDNNEIQWSIDTWYKAEKNDYEKISEVYRMIKLRARFNMATVYGVWLPKIFNTPGYDKIEDPEKYYDLILKYKFNM